jgi:hypothetical protein
MTTGRFQQPWDWRPETAEELTQRMRLFLAHGVGAELGEPRPGFGGSQAGGTAAGRLTGFADYGEWWSGFHKPKRRQYHLVQAVLANALVIRNSRRRGGQGCHHGLVDSGAIGWSRQPGVHRLLAGVRNLPGPE